MNNKPKRYKKNFNQTKPWSSIPKKPRKIKPLTYDRPQKSNNPDQEEIINKELISQAVFFCSLTSLFYILIGYLCAPWNWPIGIALLGVIISCRSLIWHPVPGSIAWSGVWVGFLMIVGSWTHQGAVAIAWKQTWQWIIISGTFISQYWIGFGIIAIITIIGVAEDWSWAIIVTTGLIRLAKSFVGLCSLSLVGALAGASLGLWALLMAWVLVKLGTWTIAVLIFMILISSKTIIDNQTVAMGVASVVIITLAIPIIKPENIKGAMVIISVISGMITMPLTIPWFKTVNRSWEALLNIFRQFQAFVILSSIAVLSLGLGWVLYRLLPALT